MAAVSNVIAMSSWRESFVNTFGAASYLGLSVSTLNKLRLTGSGPRYYKLGRAVRYRIADLDEWAEQRRTTSTSDWEHCLPQRLADPLPERKAA